MVAFLARWAITSVALALAAQVMDDIWFNGPRQGQPELEEKLLPLLGVALILSLVTAFVKPVLVILSFPFILLTLGLFLLVLNALLLMLTGWVADLFDIGFHVEGFWPAVGGAIIISVTTWILDALVGVDEKDEKAA
ncbi:phage holin family protein [Nocardioides immobilis]|uniref:Phage holin family protein n=1 Tax=Nocardioides immobilis TaxID=2049295 RepID=A0A417Y432_9ACTN|nr:phage holin family protein [Nocardioides immobilis]RHW27336.1 phage holin family protein [Nocardioides immobilis]